MASPKPTLTNLFGLQFFRSGRALGWVYPTGIRSLDSRKSAFYKPQASPHPDFKANNIFNHILKGRMNFKWDNVHKMLWHNAVKSMINEMTLVINEYDKWDDIAAAIVVSSLSLTCSWPWPSDQLSYTLTLRYPEFSNLFFFKCENYNSLTFLP